MVTIRTRLKVHVMVVDGSKHRGGAVCKAVIMEAQDLVIQANQLFLPIGKPHIVFCIAWLKTLGPIL